MKQFFANKLNILYIILFYGRNKLYFFLQAPSPFIFFLLLGRLKTSFLLPACATRIPMLPEPSGLSSLKYLENDIVPMIVQKA